MAKTEKGHGNGVTC